MAVMNRPQRNLPFLHRNWIAALNSWQAMAAKFSSPVVDEDAYTHPAKRRRLSDASPDLDPASTRDYGVLCLPEYPDDLHRAIRIDVLRILSRDSPRFKLGGILNGLTAPAAKDIVHSRSRLRLTISYERHGSPLVLHCDSQICNINTLKSGGGTSESARLNIPQPFIIPADKILITPEGRDVLDLAEAYSLRIELESVGDANWPPLNLGSHLDQFDHMSPSQAARHCTLVAEVSDLYNSCPSRRFPLKVISSSHDCYPTDMVLEVDVRWTTGFSEKLMSKRLREKDMAQSTIAITPDEKLPPIVNGGHYANGFYPNDRHAEGVNGMSGVGSASGMLDDEDDDADGDLTPNRSLRTRESKVYNLKVLSDKAQGKERRRRGKLLKWDKLSDDYSLTTYFLPAEQLTVDGFICVVCGAVTQSISQLRAHFLSHPHYVFNVEQASASGKTGGNTIAISHCLKTPGVPLRPKVYQLGRATGPLDLDKFLDGDDSWVTSRLGPDNDVVAVAPPARVPQKLTTRRSKDHRLVVPNTRQPLFNPLSRMRLEPGTEIRPVVADDRWLVNKHREVLQDYSDVAGTEKEYIKEWDSFIIGRRISSDAYIPRTLVAFAKERGPWLVASAQRMEEFGKHVSVLMARGVLDETSFDEALKRIAEARGQHKDPPQDTAAKPTLSPKEAAHRSLNGCAVCGLPVLGPSLLICSNKECTRRLYHDECIKASAKMPVDSARWYCNDCVGQREGEGTNS